jgi:hypothetical protein
MLPLEVYFLRILDCYMEDCASRGNSTDSTLAVIEKLLLLLLLDYLRLMLDLLEFFRWGTLNNAFELGREF